MIAQPGSTLTLTLDDYTNIPPPNSVLHLELIDHNNKSHYIAALDLNRGNAHALQEHNATRDTHSATAIPRVPVITKLDESDWNDVTSAYGKLLHIALYSSPDTPWHLMEISGDTLAAKLRINDHDWDQLLAEETITTVMAN